MADFIISTIQWGGYAGIVALMILENVFPPVPSEIVVPFAGFVAAQGELWFPGVVLAATLGSVLGALPWYWLGRYFRKERIKRFAGSHGRWLTLSPHDVDSAFEWFQRYGSASVFFGRMIPTIRTLISVPAGIARMNFGVFLLLTTLGSAIWVGVLAAAGLLLEARYDLVADYIEPVTWIVIGVLVVSYIYRFVTFDSEQ